jgi:NOL1/NOP2/fmu family ribosome biogenesis protein
MIKTLDKKQIEKDLEKLYGIKLPRGQVLQQSKEKLRIFTGDVSEKELNFLSSIVKVEVIGLYLAFQKENEFRLSFDALFLGQNATKNVIELDEEQFKAWIAGIEIDLNEKQQKEKDRITNPFVLLKYQDNIVGCGKLALADNRILNFVPKERRLFL